MTSRGGPLDHFCHVLGWIFEALGGQEEQKGNKMGGNGGDGRVMVVKVVLLFGIATFTVTDTTLVVPISMRITTTSSPTVVERTQVQETTTWSPMNSDSGWRL